MGLVCSEHFYNKDCFLSFIKAYVELQRALNHKVLLITGLNGGACKCLPCDLANLTSEVVPCKGLENHKWSPVAVAMGVVKGSDVIVAFPTPQSRIVWFTIRMANRHGIPVIIVDCKNTSIRFLEELWPVKFLKLRKERRMPVARMAEMVGYSSGQYVLLEKGLYIPDEREAERLINIYLSMRGS